MGSTGQAYLSLVSEVGSNPTASTSFSPQWGKPKKEGFVWSTALSGSACIVRIEPTHHQQTNKVKVKKKRTARTKSEYKSVCLPFGRPFFFSLSMPSYNSSCKNHVFMRVFNASPLNGAKAFGLD